MREYDPDELENFAKYVEARAEQRPRECKPKHPRCWVTYGPPAVTTKGACAGCRGRPLGPRVHYGKPPRYA